MLTPEPPFNSFEIFFFDVSISTFFQYTFNRPNKSKSTKTSRKNSSLNFEEFKALERLERRVSDEVLGNVKRV